MADIYAFEPLWGNWYIDEPLGAGGSGTVYKAHQDLLGHTYYCAIKHISVPRDRAELKSISDELATNDAETLNSYFDEVAKKTIDECDIQKQFTGYPNFVQLYDAFYQKKTDMMGFDLFIRMECLNSINTRISAAHADEKEVMRMAIDICTALDTLQKQNLVHRDIKPQNILVTEDGIYKLADFGTAGSTFGTDSYMSLKGTLDYIAPEILAGAKADHRIDIYSLGIVLYRLMNHNMLPFMKKDGGLSKEVANGQRLMGAQLPAPVEASQEFAEIILKACEFDPKNRWASAEEMRSQLLKMIYLSA